MQCYYLDNFRGFTDTVISASEVNFLVGENSTGKTSFLSVVKLFGDMDFMFDHRFNDPPVSLGAFSDIVSKKSKKRNYFTIGNVSSKSTDDGNQSYHGTILKFHKEGDVPVLKECMMVGKTSSHIIIHPKTISIKAVDTSSASSIESLTKTAIDVFNNQKKGFTKINLSVKRRSAFGVIRELTSLVAENNKKKKTSSTFEDLEFQAKGIQSSAWIAPIRSKPKSIYEPHNLKMSPGGEHVPIMINEILSLEKAENRPFSDLLCSFGEDSALFDRIETQSYGKRKDAPFRINVNFDNSSYRLNTVGYGVAQVLPIIVDVLIRRSKRFLIQQPEVHLHPKAQAALGDFFYYNSIGGTADFIIETHSDYLIDRFRLAISQNDEKVESQVLFFQRTKDGNKVTPISIDINGRYSDKQPEEFREFFLNEELNLLEL